MDPFLKLQNEAIIAEIMKDTFDLHLLQQYIEDIQQPRSSNSPQNSPLQSPQKSRLKISSSASISETKDISSMLMDLLNLTTQNTIQEFIYGLKKERVPIQKNILKKVALQLEKSLNSMLIPNTAVAKLQQLILSHQTVLLFALCHISKPILDFFDNHFTDYAEELQISIQEVNLYLFQAKMVVLIKEHLISQMNLTQTSVFYGIIQNCPLLPTLAFEVSDQICLILEESRGYIDSLIMKFKDKVSSCPQLLMNKFVHVALFLELSRNCYQTIQDLLEYTIFHYAEPDISDKFMKFTIENYDTLILKNKNNQFTQTNNKSRRTIAEVLDSLNQSFTNKNKQISVYKIQNNYDPQLNGTGTIINDDCDEDFSPTKQLASQMTDTRSVSTGTYSMLPRPIKLKNHLHSKLHLQGLYIECEEAQFKYIVYLHNKDFNIIYAPLVSRRWTFQKTFVVDQQSKEGFFKKDSHRKSGWGVHPVVYSGVKDMLESSWFQEQLASMITWQNLSVSERFQRTKLKKVDGEMDTMFGSFLAHVSRTNKLQQYLQNFGENAVNNGCMKQLMVYMPLLKDFLTYGGFGQQALQTHSEVFTPDRRITPVSTIAMTTTFVSGAIVGQILIPIPIFGGLVGGFLGGYLGNKGMSSFSKSRNTKLAAELSNKLLPLQQQDGFWVCNKQVLDILNISFKILQDTTPKTLKDDVDRQTKWMNLSIYGFLSLYFTQQQGEWPESLEGSQRYLSMEKLPILESLDNLKQIIDIIIKNL